MMWTAAFALFLLGATLSYSKSIHQYRFFPVAVAAVACLCGLLWAYICRSTAERDRIVVYSVYWDVLIATAYYLLPALCGVIQMTSISYCGIVLIIGGLILLHL